MTLLMNLIETIYWFLQPANWLIIFKVAAGLGFVIFVHELGHFAVAKWCGVRCPKFYVGFDAPIGRFFDWLIESVCSFVMRRPISIKFFARFIPGTLAKWKHGETEYGIGILPLGGYVKMLGQDDDPSQAATEMALIEKQRQADAAGKDVPADQRIPQARVQELLDPKSYVTKSVPQRLAIITAGVIMNVIFAFLMATLAYWMGVEKTEAEIGQVVAGGPAWKAGLLPGDKILEIGGEEIRYYEDLQAHVVYKDHNRDTGIKFKVSRPGVSEPVELILKPSSKLLAPKIHVTSSRKLVLADPIAPRFSRWMLATKGEKDENKLLDGDQVISIDGEPVSSYREFETKLIAKASQPIQLAIKRQVKDQPEQQLTLTIPPQPMRDFGLSMTLGPITAIRANSPAAEAGLQEGDRLLKINNEAVGVPEQLEQRFLTMLNQSVELLIERQVEGKPQEVKVTVKPRAVTWLEDARIEFAPLPVSSIGICCQIEPIISQIDPTGPAAKSGLKTGMKIDAVQFLAPENAPPGKLFARDAEVIPLTSTDPKRPAVYTWPMVVDMSDFIDPTCQLRLIHRDESKQEQKFDILPGTSTKDFVADRGLVFKSMDKPLPSDFGSAVSMGLQTTGEKLAMVISFLKRLFTGEISVKALGGPVSIAGAAGQAASGGFTQLLMFLVMLSANLAVVNILPIPVLDGGHVVFLIYEWITGKPMPANFFAVLMYIGVAMILTLMLFVIGLDVGIIPRF